MADPTRVKSFWPRPITTNKRSAPFFKTICVISSKDGPWPDPTRAYFWPTVNKRPTRLQPGYFPTQPEEIFIDPKGKKLKNLTFLGQIFQIQTQTINGWPDPTRPDPSRKKLTRPNPGQKFWPKPITNLYWWVWVKPGLGQVIFLLLGSGQVGSATSGFGKLGLKNLPLNMQIFHFFVPLCQKKYQQVKAGLASYFLAHLWWFPAYQLPFLCFLIHFLHLLILRTKKKRSHCKVNVAIFWLSHILNIEIYYPIITFSWKISKGFDEMIEEFSYFSLQTNYWWAFPFLNLKRLYFFHLAKCYFYYQQRSKK